MINYSNKFNSAQSSTKTAMIYGSLLNLPNIWKEATVILDSTDTTNYRSIALTSCMYNRMELFPAFMVVGHYQVNIAFSLWLSI